MVPGVAVSLQNKMSCDQLKALEGVGDVVLQHVALLQSSSSVGWKAPHCPRQREESADSSASSACGTLACSLPSFLSGLSPLIL